MANHTFQLPEKVISEILRPPYWDPIPPWLEFSKEMLIKFTDLEVQFKIKELQIQQEKLEQFGKMMR
jgi:hypothetical protein